MHVQLSNGYTRDNVAIDLALKIFHMVDLRQVNPERRIQALRFPTGITRNQIVVSRSFAELTSPEGRSNLKQLLSFTLAGSV